MNIHPNYFHEDVLPVNPSGHAGETDPTLLSPPCNLAKQVGVKTVSFKANKILRSIRNKERKQLLAKCSN